MILQDGTPAFEAVTDLLAEIFVKEYERRREVATATGVSPGGYTRSVAEAATSS